MEHCAANTLTGQPCRAHPRTGSRFCFTHDPACAAARSEARRRGGIQRTTPNEPGRFSSANLMTSKGLRAFAQELIRLTREEKISSVRSRTLGYLLLAQRRLIELDTLAERVHALESILKNREEPNAE